MAKINARTMAFRWLMIGIGLIASCVGTLTGLSSSPVAAASIAAICALLPAGVSFITQKSLLDRLSVLQADASSADEMSDLVDRLTDILKFSGVGLTVFAVCFIATFATGSMTRIKWSESQMQRSFPWDETDFPTNFNHAIEWIIIQESLVNRGYSQQQVRQFFEKSRDMVAVKHSDFKELDRDELLRILVGLRTDQSNKINTILPHMQRFEAISETITIPDDSDNDP